MSKGIGTIITYGHEKADHTGKTNSRKQLSWSWKQQK